MGVMRQVEKVTPAKAEAWLNRNTVNRRLKQDLVDRYSADMTSGQWTTCPMPICFFENGDVADGQHRLWAIVESGATVEFEVLRGLPREAGLNIDRGKPRSVIDNVVIAGDRTDVSILALGVSRGIEFGVAPQNTAETRSLSDAQKLAILDQHAEAAHWAIKSGPTKRGLRNVQTLSAMGRAWYLVSDHQRLAQFGQVVGTGFSDGDGDSAAIAYRNYLLNNYGKLAARMAWRDTFLKCQNAIRNFMDSNPMTLVRPVKDEAYPLPKNKRTKM